MVITLPIRLVLISTLLLSVWPRTLAAQSETSAGGGQEGAAPQTGGEETDNGSTRPFRGLFGLPDAERTGAAMSGTLFGAYNENVTATLPGAPLDPRYHRSGWYTGANAQLSFNWRGDRSAANGWAHAGTSYYPDFDRPLVPTYSGGIGFGGPLGQRNSYHLSQSALYSPYFLNGFFPTVPVLDELPAPPVTGDPALNVSGDTIAHYTTEASISRQLSRVSTVTAGYLFGRTNYTAVDRQYQQQYASIQFRRGLTRHATLRLGYGYRAVTHESPLPDVPAFQRDSQDITIGVDYNRSIAFSMSRRTRLQFSTGTSYIGRSHLSDSGGLATSSRSRFFVTGSAQLIHEIARTWTATAVYRRSVGFSELVFEPIISDSYAATLSGYLGRRDQITAVVSASQGAVGTVRSNNDYSSYVASAQWRHALSHNLAAYVRYAYYRHDFAQSIRLPSGFPQALTRNGVDFGLNVWLPLR